MMMSSIFGLPQVHAVPPASVVSLLDQLGGGGMIVHIALERVIESWIEKLAVSDHLAVYVDDRVLQ